MHKRFSFSILMTVCISQISIPAQFRIPITQQRTAEHALPMLTPPICPSVQNDAITTESKMVLCGSSLKKLLRYSVSSHTGY